MKSIRKMLEGLTLEDLREWAGRKIYTRGKDYVPCVSQLSRIEDGTLVACGVGSGLHSCKLRGGRDVVAISTYPSNDCSPASSLNSF